MLVQYRLWDEQSALWLINTYYPKFLPTWESYKDPVIKGNSL